MCSACITIAPVAVEQRGGGVAALLDVRRVRGAHEHGAHLLAHRPHAAQQHLQGDRVEAAAHVRSSDQGAVLVDRAGPARAARRRSPPGAPTPPGRRSSRPVPRAPRRMAVSSRLPSNSAVRRPRSNRPAGAGVDRGVDTFLDRAHAHVHELDRALGVAVAVAVLVRLLEQLAQLGRAGVRGRRHLQLEGLAPVAQVVVGLEARARHAGAGRGGEVARPRRRRVPARSLPRPAARCAPRRGAGRPSRGRVRTALPLRAGRARGARPAARPAARRASARRRRRRPARSRAGRRRARPSRRAARAASPRPRRARSRPPPASTSRPSSPASLPTARAGGLQVEPHIRRPAAPRR